MMESLKKVTAGDSADGLIDEFSMPQFYLCILYHARDNLKRILEFAMEPSHHPLIVNCTMGKDRTGNSPQPVLCPRLRVDVLAMRAGTVVFLLLRALGVETEQCLRDYELSDSAASRAMMQVKVDKFAGSLNVEPSTLAPLMAKAMGADREWMRAVGEAVEAKWGGIDGYLRWLGVDAAKVDAFRDAMLE